MTPEMKAWGKHPIADCRTKLYLARVPLGSSAEKRQDNRNYRDPLAIGREKMPEP